MSCCHVFAGVSIVTTVAMGPEVFSRLALAIFIFPYFFSTLLLSSYIATICVYENFEVVNNVGESRDLADDGGVGLC